MTVLELVNSCDTAIRGQIAPRRDTGVRAPAWITYIAQGAGECDRCQKSYRVGELIIGAHLHYEDRPGFEEEVNQVYCSTRCAELVSPLS